MVAIFIILLILLLVALDALSYRRGRSRQQQAPATGPSAPQVVTSAFSEEES
jgi:hypothetical protein